MNQSRIISAVATAEKDHAAYNLEAPKYLAAVLEKPVLREFRWFCQGISMVPGGLETFASETWEMFPHCQGTKVMRDIGKVNEPYAKAEAKAANASFPSHNGYLWTPGDWTIAPEGSPSRAIIEEFNFDTRGKPDFIAKLKPSDCYELCRRFFIAEIPAILRKFCTERDSLLTGLWCFADLPDSLIEAMLGRPRFRADKHALTEGACLIDDAIEFILQEKAAVKVIGNTRSGKTETIKSFAEANPGKVRYLRTPSSNTMRGLLEAFAEAFGIPVGLDTPTRELERYVPFVVKNSGLGMLVDESHNLFPSPPNRNTRPKRIDWLRDNVLDREIPLLLVETPQTKRNGQTIEQKYVGATGYVIGQFNKRIAETVRLPDEPSNADLTGVVEIKFPTTAPALVARVISAIKTSSEPPCYWDAEAVLKHARFASKRAGRETMVAEDIDYGIKKAGFNIPANPMLRQAAPPSAPVPAAAQHRPPAPAPQRATTPAPPVAESNPPARRRASASDILPAPRRETSPVLTPA